jgi:hypothetical protein
MLKITSTPKAKGKRNKFLITLMPYGEYMDFSSVLLPGVGGQLNASNAISTDQLMKKNKVGHKWSPTLEGGLSMHKEAILKGNKAIRERRANLVNKDYDSHADGADAMKEIMGRRKARIDSFKEIKRKEYNFADDTELMLIPQPFKEGGCKSCQAGNCRCSSCKSKLDNSAKFREWDAKSREKLKAGKTKGEFAGPGTSFPIASPQDVAAAWSSVGRTANPRKVMAAIIRIAIKNKWESGLPETVRQRLKDGESGLPGND